MAFCREIDPVLPEDRDHELEDQAFELVSSASSLAGQLHPLVQAGVGDLVLPALDQSLSGAWRTIRPYLAAVQAMGKLKQS